MSVCAAPARRSRVLWAWSFFVVGGAAFQKTAEHWQVVVPGGDRTGPAAAFDMVQVAAVAGSAAVLTGVALALPAFVRDLRGGGWSALHRPILSAASTTSVAAGALVSVAVDHNRVASLVFVAFALISLFAWTHAAAAAARRIALDRVQSDLAVVVSATMAVMTAAAAVWFAAVMTRSSSFVGAAQLAVVALFMLCPTALAATSSVRSLRR